MKVLQINSSDYANGGGGAIAMHRLHTGLKKADIDCKILSALKTLDSPDSKEINRSHKIEKAIKKITANVGLNDIHCISSFKIKKDELYQQADILNFHIIHSGVFSYLALPSLTKDKPAVFTLHDMWSITGHCAINYDCQRWKTGCGNCPYPQAYPPVSRDNTRWEWQMKNWAYSNSNLTIVTLSNWQTEQVKQSMLNRFEIHRIPNGIDTQAYQPLDSEKCRFVLGIPANKKVLMFAAENLKYWHKGGDLLLKALSNLPESLKKETVLLTLGSSGESLSKDVGIETLSLGYVSSDRLKSMAYSAADLFVSPTRADNLPLVLQESMACGTPMVSFNVGGVSDLVRTGITGYLAAPENAKDLCLGIIQMLEDNNLRERSAHNCRAIALEEYPLELQIQKYIDLYNKVLKF